MQRLGSINRNKENKKNDIKESTQYNLEINNDLLFLISRIINHSVYIDSMSRSSRASSQRKQEKSLEIRTAYAIHYDFKRNRKSRCIILRDSMRLRIEDLDGLSLEKLELDNIADFELGFLKDFKLSTLIVKNTSISPEKFGLLIKTLSPKNLVMKNIQKPTNKDGEREDLFYRQIIDSSIQSLEVENCFVSEEHFFDIVNKKSLKKFKYQRRESIVKYRCLGPQFSYFLFRNFDITRQVNNNIDWLSVEILSIDNSLVLTESVYNKNRIKFLCLESIKIDSNLARTLPKLVSLFLNKCTFASMGFYELINAQKNTLRYISFTSADIPLDGLNYIHKNIPSCKIMVNFNQ